MAISETLPISIKDLEVEFVAPAGTPLSEFVKGGSYVPDNTENADVPTALPLAITDFYGAAATEPVVLTILHDPLNLDPVEYQLDSGSLVVSQHNDLLPYFEAGDKYVIECRVKCNTGHSDGGDLSPQLPGYSWARQRMSIIMGVDSETAFGIAGAVVDIYFTSATTGYVRVRYRTDLDDSVTLESGVYYHDEASTVYGNFVIPDDTEFLDIKFTRGDSGLTQYSSSGTRYSPNHNLTLYSRDTGEVWKDIQLASAERYVSDFGGPLAVANNVYEGSSSCNLEFASIEGAVGTTVIS